MFSYIKNKDENSTKDKNKSNTNIDVCIFDNFTFSDKENKKIQKKEIKKMLIVDDIEIASNIMKDFILLSGYNLEIDCVNSGDECLKILEKDNNYDIIFMDLLMYPKDGYETSEEVIKKYKNIIVFALTGMVDNESIKRCKKIGIIDIFQKPVNYDDLIEKVQDYGLFFVKN